MRIVKSISNRIRTSIKKCVSSQQYTGCTRDKLLAHLESKFDDEMTWDNYGFYGWHIDHIRPVSSFDLTKKSHIAKCFHYTNLQPLWGTENMSKGAKYNPMNDDDDDQDNT